MIAAPSASAGSLTRRSSSEVLLAPRKPERGAVTGGFGRPSGRGGHFTCELWSAAGVTTIGGGVGAGFLGFGFGALASSDAAAAAAAPSLAASLRTLGFGFGAAVSPDDAAAVDAPSLPASLAPSLAPSLAAVAFGFGFGAAWEVAALVADAPSLSLSLAAAGLITAVFFFSGFDSVDACAPGAGGLVPV